MLEQTERIHSEIFLFYLSWSRSRTLTPALTPTKKFRLRFCNTAYLVLYVPTYVLWDPGLLKQVIFDFSGSGKISAPAPTPTPTPQNCIFFIFQGAKKIGPLKKI